MWNFPKVRVAGDFLRQTGGKYMRHSFWSALAALIVSPLVSTSVLAGGKALSCYEQATVPAVYKTVNERVLVQPASTYVVQKPAVYSYQARRVLVQPERVSYRTSPAVYQTRQSRVLVQPASVGWEYRVINGRNILCKVQNPAVYRTVSQKVLVQSASRVAVRQPAIYSSVKEKVLVQPATSYRVQKPAVYQTVSRRVLVQPAQTVWKPVKVRGCRY